MARRFIGRTSIRDAIDSAVIGLQAAGCHAPRLDAEFLLAVAMGLDRATLLARSGEPVDRDVQRLFMGWVMRRQAREPVAYIVGVKPFRNVELVVDRRVLIPRDATEALVEAAVAELPEGALVAEIGTGSGAISVALADERPDLRLIATEVSPEAAAVARENIASNGVRVELREGDLLAPVAEPVDAVIANLPYIPDGDKAGLMPDVGRYEPPVALFGGPDGLYLARRLLADVPRVRPAWLAMEAGTEEQLKALAALVEETGFDAVEIRAELGGVPRIVVARRSTPW